MDESDARRREFVHSAFRQVFALHSMRVDAMAISRITVSVLVLAVAAIWTPPASGQTASNGAIRGYVRDATGAVVPGTTVTATAPDATTPFSALTDAEGYYRLLD